MVYVKSLFSALWSFLKYPVYLMLLVAGFMLLIVCFFFVASLCKGKRLKRGTRVRVKHSGILKQLFWEAPRMFVDDLFNIDPDYFTYQGLVIYTGYQGAGKTIAMVHDTMMMQQEFPRCKCITNLGYKKEDRVLNDWRQLITYKNGIYGVIVCIDEVQNWFSSKQSKDFPLEMFEVVTQNRKNRRIILATTQNFYQPAKDIRAQCSEVRKCLTFFNVFTVVHAVRPILDSSGDVKQWKHLRFYSFAHTPEIRKSYDTYKVIESLAKSGFVERGSSSTTKVSVNLQSGGKKK